MSNGPATSVPQRASGTLPATWEAAASEALEALVPVAISTYRDQRSHLDDLIYLYDNGAGFSHLGKVALKGWVRSNGRADFTVDDHQEFVRLLASKQHDYGHENILKHGEHGVLVRLWDKIARLRNLLERGTEAKHESLLDTWADLVGYCVIGVMLDRGTFGLPLAADRPQQRDGRIHVTTSNGVGHVYEVTDGPLLPHVAKILEGGAAAVEVYWGGEDPQWARYEWSLS